MVFLLAVALSAAPVHVEELGFTVEVRDRAVVVTHVDAKSPAAKAKLAPGVVLVRVTLPISFIAQGKPLAELAAEDLHTVLTPAPQDALVLEVRRGERDERVVLKREDTPTEPEFTHVLSPEEYRRLSTNQMARYNAWQMTEARARTAAARERVPIADFSASPHAWVVDGRVVDTSEAASTSDWVYFVDHLRLHCPNSAPTGGEVHGAGPVLTRASTGRSPPVQELALWRVRDVVKACLTKTPTLDAEVRVEVRCAGEPKPRQATLAIPLQVTCGPRVGERPSERHSGAVYVRPDTLTTGDAGVPVRVRWRMFRPQPTEATVVELGERGAVVRRYQGLRRPPEDDPETNVVAAVDTRQARTVRVGVELTFVDGSRELVPGEPVEIITPAERATRDAQWSKDSADSRAVLDRLLAHGDPCRDIAATVQWLKDQPGVTRASDDKGHSVSFRVGRVPQLVLCHGGY